MYEIKDSQIRINNRSYTTEQKSEELRRDPRRRTMAKSHFGIWLYYSALALHRQNISEHPHAAISADPQSFLDNTTFVFEFIKVQKQLANRVAHKHCICLVIMYVLLLYLISVQFICYYFGTRSPSVHRTKMTNGHFLFYEYLKQSQTQSPVARA